MIFGANLGENLMMAASDKWLFISQLTITIRMKVATRNINIEIYHLFSN